MSSERRAGRAVPYRLAAELRTRWKAWLGLALAIGLAGGIALAAAAGARRTASAYSRLLDSVEQDDAFLASISPDGRFNDTKNPILLDVARLPQVERSGGLAQLLAGFGTKVTEQAFNAGLGSLALVNGSGYDFDRPKILEGRIPNRRKVNETLINPNFAGAHHLEVGSRFPLMIISSDALDAALAKGTAYDGPVGRRTMTVTGIGQFARDVVPTTVNDESPISYVTPAFFAKYPWSLVNYGSVVRLRPGVDVEQFHTDVLRIAAGYGVPAQKVYFTTQRDRTETVTRAVRPQTLALALLALVVALAAFLVGGQALSRQVFVDSTDSPVLGAVGMTRRQRFALAMTRVALVGSVGAALAVVLAIAASPLFPIGIARDAEPTAGLSFDAAVLFGGFALIAVGFLVRGALPAWTGASASPGTLGVAEPDRAHPSRIAEQLHRSGFRPARVIGVRMAFEPGRGRTSVPVRSALVTTALAVAAVAAVFTFSTNLNRLAETPERYGWGWTGSVGFGFDPLPSEVTRRLVDNPDITGVAGANYRTLTVARRAIPLVTYERLKGNVGPVILAGRAARGSAEVALGSRTLRESGLSIGDRVPVSIGDQRATMRIVGRAVFPRLGAGSFTPTDLGQGAAMTQAALTRLGIDTSDPTDPDARYSVYFVRAAPGVSFAALSSQVNRDLKALVSDDCVDFCVSSAQRPGDIVAYRRVRTTTMALVALLGLMAIAALAHSLVTSVRRRRRDLALLKTLGFVGKQISSTVRWQGLALAAAALAVGVPLGLVTGRALWSLFADAIGVATDASIPLLPVALAIPATLVAAALIAIIPARIARRTRPATILRTA